MATETDAVNRLLIARGVTPVTDISSGHPDVVAARQILAAWKRAVSADKWWFNTEEQTLSPDENDNILIPSGCESIDNDQGNKILNGKLYNIEDRSVLYDDDVEDLILIYNRDWEDLPVQAWDYIVALAKEEFIRPLESALLSKGSEQDVQKARVVLDIANYRYNDTAKQTGNPLMQAWQAKMLTR